MIEELEAPVIHGAGGGKKPKAARAPVEAPNTLRSVVKGRILDLLAYGPILGLVDGLKSVKLDDTRVMNDDGSLNFQGISLVTREGTPDQDFIPGFRAVENTTEINTEVLFAAPPVRSISNGDADAALVTLQLSSLNKQQDNGDLVGYSVGVAIDVRSGGGAWQVAASDTISGKTTSPYPITYRVPLSGTGPFDVRVRRLSEESQVTATQDQVNWTLLTEVIDARLSYPNMAMVGIEVDSELFGTQMPSRSYELFLSIISVPTNYDPQTRVYTGLWDGSFKQAWTDNPAWAFYDLATHPIIGAGISNVDKWALYGIAQYCDELVPDGYGGMEPRFTCNTIFADQEEALVALSTLASVFRGMAYWGTDTVVPVADQPTDPVKIVTPGNVVDGDFEYSGTSLRERHSVAVVMWNDPEDGGKAVPEVYEDPDSVVAFGWRETRVTAVACSSRGQAHRLGKWILDSERTETETVTYKATLDHADVRPGNILELADPDRQGARMGGRVVTPGTTEVVLDQVPTAAVQSTASAWFLSVLMPDGTVAKAEVSSFVGNSALLLSALPAAPIPGAVWALSCIDLQLPQYRVVSVSEDPDTSVYTITATEYDPNKYARVELGLTLAERPTSLLPTGPVLPPLSLSFASYTYFAGTSDHQGLSISWTPAKDPRVSGYILDVKAPNDGGFRTVYNGPGTSYDLKDVTGGQWTVRVRSVSSAGIPSAWVSSNVQIAVLLLPVPPDSVQVTVGTFEVTLWPISAYPHAVYEFWRSDVPLSVDLIESNATQLPTGNYLVDAGLRAGRTYFYYVRGTNQYGLSTWFAVQATTLEDFDDILGAITEDVTGGALYGLINEQIEVITNPLGAQVGSLQTDLDAAEAQIAALSTLPSQVADLGSELDALQGQVNGIVDALAYDPGSTYLEGESVRSGQRLYTALQAVPVSTPPPNATYWKDVGTLVDDLGGLAAVVQTNSASIEEVEGVVTAQATDLSALRAAWRDEDGEGELQDALRAAQASASFAEEVKVRASEDDALSQRITSLDATVDDVSANLTVLQQTTADADSAMALQITALEASTETNTASIQTTQVALAELDAATASDITSLQSGLAATDGNVATAQAAAQAASDLAGGKGKVLAQSTTPVAGDQLAQNLWIDTTGGANTPKRWNGSAWAAVTDKVATDAAAAAAAALAAGAANASAISALNTTVSQHGADITAQSSAITALESGLADTESDVAGNASAISSLNTSVASVQGVVVSQASDLSALRAAYRGDDGEGDLQDALAAVNSAASVAAEKVVRASQDDALAQSITALTATVDGVSASVVTEQTARATADSALASSITTLQATTSANAAAISAEQTARASADTAMATDISTVQASVATKNKTYRQATAPASGMTAGDIWYDSDDSNKPYRYSGSAWAATEDTRIAANTASVQTVSNSLASLDGSLSAMWAVKLQLTADGRAYAAGMGIDLTTSGGVTQSQVLFQADRFAVTTLANGQATLPFVIDGGTVYMSSAMIKAASIDFAKISDTIQSTNYVANTSGWKLSKAGGFEINGTVAGQGRVKITNQVVEVFDSAGVRRVRLGIW